MGAPETAGDFSVVSPAEDGNDFILLLSVLMSFGHGIFFLRAQIFHGGEKNLPNAKVLSEKQAIVEALAERIKNSSAGVLVDYQGINVADDTKLRRELRDNDICYTVVKNTLTRFALHKLGIEELDGVLNGATSLATSTGDPIAPIRILSDYAEKSADCFTIKAAFMDGKILDDAEIKEIAALPSKDALYAQVFGTLLAPITSLAVVLNEIAKKQGYTETEAAPEAAE